MHIEWSSLRFGRDDAQRTAEQLAASMRGGDTGSAFTTSVHETVIGAPGRPMPGQDGGGLTPEQAAGAASAPGMQRGTARVLAAHEVAVPPGTPGAPAAGLIDLTLDVSLPNGDAFSTTTRIGFSTPAKRVRIATVGTELPVFVDPQARDRIAIDGASLGL